MSKKEGIKMPEQLTFEVFGKTQEGSKRKKLVKAPSANAVWFNQVKHGFHKVYNVTAVNT